MNERIKQLAESVFLLKAWGAGNDDNFSEALEEFAELIVKECVQVARGADGLDATHEAWYLIKEHFGVEE